METVYTTLPQLALIENKFCVILGCNTFGDGSDGCCLDQIRTVWLTLIYRITLQSEVVYQMSLSMSMRASMIGAHYVSLPPKPAYL